MNNLHLFRFTVNYLTNPCGIDETPRFSFQAESGLRGDALSGFTVTVSDSPAFEKKTVVWKKSFPAGTAGVLIPYAGESLSPLTRYYVKIDAKSKKGASGSLVGSFVTGKLDSRWDGRWITANFIRREDSAFAAPYLRKTFTLDKPVKNAYLAMSGLGYFESYINGKKTGDDWLSPAFTRYDADIKYMVYDVTGLVAEGRNALAVVLGNGWYNCFAEDPWNTRAASWRHWPKVIGELHVTYEDGTEIVIPTDPTWKSSHGPIVFNGIRNGEHYDARLELDGWTEADYDDSAWEGTKIMKSPGGLLTAMEMEPIRAVMRFPAVKNWQAPSGAYIYDIGQNQAGVGDFTFRGKAGTEIQIRYSDVITEAGEIDVSAIGCFIRSHGFQTDKYIKKSDEEEHWHPIFVYHGFQYMEITGVEEAPALSDVGAITLCTDVGDAGCFSCSDELLSRVQHLCRWSTISNMHSIPTDSPHREKNGWTGDTSMSSEQMLMNFGTGAFLSKWANDMRVSQRPAGQIPCVVPSTGWGYYGLMGPDWSSALINVPYNIYLYHGDKEVLRKSYEAIKRNVDFMEGMTVDYTLNYGTGDWCAPFEGPALSVNMGSYKCPVEVSDTGFFYNAACMVGKIADLFGYGDDAAYYRDLAAKIRATFREKFFDPATFTVKGDCQTATAVMLYFELYDNEEERLGLVDRLKKQIERDDWHLDFGVIGCKFVMEVLGASGEGDIGHRMLAQRTFPGCQRWIDLGATTLWECWNGGGSHNHHMFSSLSAFLYKYVGGIAPDEKQPGFAHTVFRPAVDCGMESASASHDSPLGKVACHWQNKDGKLTLSVTVPFGGTGSLYLPAHYADTLTEDGKKATDFLASSVSEKEVSFILPSGEYHFIA
ncbi:MAG: family 78 glycoside hydrolase catalytic domain [Ruminococcus sp.]|nr:family 78 glycoside hydrolase catalytic domain [Candidatus Apopatosoma intestinale]